MNNLKTYVEYNKKEIIVENFKINEGQEATATFNMNVGRLMWGFQEACYNLADRLGLDIDIRRFGGVLSVGYRIKLTGDSDKIYQFKDHMERLAEEHS